MIVVVASIGKVYRSLLYDWGHKNMKRLNVERVIAWALTLVGIGVVLIALAIDVEWVHIALGLPGMIAGSVGFMQVVNPPTSDRRT